ncbi:MAG TPA: hypothetical protein VE953_09105 [Terriglobales bacterium]|nr:hypothetical protein [Terriglobales bacterium]
MDPEHTDSDVVSALRAEVSAWRPRQVPDLVELTDRLADSWRRPVALASAFGAAALATLLLVSLVVVALATANVGWAGTVKDHLINMP